MLNCSNCKQHNNHSMMTKSETTSLKENEYACCEQSLKNRGKTMSLPSQKNQQPPKQQAESAEDLTAQRDCCKKPCYLVKCEAETWLQPLPHKQTTQQSKQQLHLHSRMHFLQHFKTHVCFFIIIMSFNMSSKVMQIVLCTFQV